MEKIIQQDVEVDLLPYLFITFISLLTFRGIKRVEMHKRKLEEQLAEQKDELWKL